ncbi:MAG: chaperone modulator CbpM [Candidatus Rokubacteria bacterium]|nr:chaperone modulator CbpM [Candidatus Rokubacteria bacterium]
MRPPPRTRLDTPLATRPRDRHLRLSAEELAAAAGITPARLALLVRLGLVEPDPPGAGEFTAASAFRLRRMLRLHADLGVNLIGAAIAVDLLERIDRLEAELARWRRAGTGDPGRGEAHP